MTTHLGHLVDDLHAVVMNVFLIKDKNILNPSIVKDKVIDIARKASIAKILYTNTFKFLSFLMELIHATLQIRQLKIKITMSSPVNGPTVKIKRFMT